MRIAVRIKENGDQAAAERLAGRLQLPLLYSEPDENLFDLILQQDEEGLALVGNGQLMRADLSKMLPRLARNNLNGELLVKAARLKNFDGVPLVVDATAGLGEDSILLAAAGFQVKLFERDQVIAALLEDALRRAGEIPELADIVGRMELFATDSVVALSNLSVFPDVVLLDPMFPARQKSGLIKKKFQLLQKLERPCSEEEVLLQAALDSQPRKIVIKRPLKGPNLADRKPDYSLKGKAIRYDCIVLPPRI